MNKVALMQPYLFPYIGYFQLLNSVDIFVVYDDAQWMKGGWINRNRILVEGKPEYITLPIKKGSLNDRIYERVFVDDFENQKKLLINKIVSAYSEAPYFKDVYEFIMLCFASKEKNASLFIANTLRNCCDYLSISTPIIFSSDLKKTPGLKSQDRVIDISKVLGATHYINAIGGRELYDKNAFLEQNMELFFIKSNEIVYKQFSDDFVPNLSIIDVMMFNSPGEIRVMLDKYELI